MAHPCRSSSTCRRSARVARRRVRARLISDVATVTVRRARLRAGHGRRDRRGRRRLGQDRLQLLRDEGGPVLRPRGGTDRRARGDGRRAARGVDRHGGTAPAAGRQLASRSPVPAGGCCATRSATSASRRSCGPSASHRRCVPGASWSRTRGPRSSHPRWPMRSGCPATISGLTCMRPWCSPRWSCAGTCMAESILAEVSARTIERRVRATVDTAFACLEVAFADVDRPA